MEERADEDPEVTDEPRPVRVPRNPPASTWTAGLEGRAVLDPRTLEAELERLRAKARRS